MTSRVLSWTQSPWGPPPPGCSLSRSLSVLGDACPAWMLEARQLGRGQRGSRAEAGRAQPTCRAVGTVRSGPVEKPAPDS